MAFPELSMKVGIRLQSVDLIRVSFALIVKASFNIVSLSLSGMEALKVLDPPWVLCGVTGTLFMPDLHPGAAQAPDKANASANARIKLKILIVDMCNLLNV
jgi:hypothetical protein